MISKIPFRRGLPGAVLGLGLLCCSPVATAQDLPGAETGEGEATSSGNPLYGYLGAAVIGAFSIFVLCKSSRR